MQTTHPRISKLADFYRTGSKVCSFMSPDITRFVLVPEVYHSQVIAEPLLDWAKTKKPMALSYVWEKDPLNMQDEEEIAIRFFTGLLKILKEDEFGEQINHINLEAELRFAFSDASPVHPHLSYRDDGFYTITMGPKQTSRYAPCFSIVITRVSDIMLVHKDIAQKIRKESAKRFGSEYDANTLYLKPK